MKKKFITIFGPTGTGKSALAIELAQKLGGEIVNCDSIQLYKRFDIGSAKPALSERNLVPHHLFDLLEPTQDFDAAQYSKAAQEAISNIINKGSIPIIVGGTGLYLRALLEQRFDQLPKCEKLREELAVKSNIELMQDLSTKSPQRAQELHINDRVRLLRALEIAILLEQKVSHPTQPPSHSPDTSSFNIRISVPRIDLLPRLELRCKTMLKDGLIQEVNQLLSDGVPKDCKPMQSIGYKQVVESLHTAISETELLENIFIATRQYAKKQETWFKKSPYDVHLKNFPSTLTEEISETFHRCEEFINSPDYEL